MAINPIFLGKIQNNKVIFENKDKFEGYLINLEGKDVEIIVRKRKKNRSIPQNNYYFGVVVAIPAEHFGYTPDEMHESFKWMFLRRHAEGKPETVRSTTSLTTVEFTSYVEQCRQWCAENKIYIPDPGEVDYDGKYERTEAEKSTPVSIKTLKELFSLADNGKIMEICAREFNGRNPKDLTQEEAERLDTIIVTETI